MAYDQKLDKELHSFPPIEVFGAPDVKLTTFHVRIKTYGKTAPKIEITKTYFDANNNELETQKLGRISRDVVVKLASYLTEAAFLIDSGKLV